MSVSNQLTTGCLCGAVSVAVNNTVQSVGACHCSMCRKWGGGPLLAIDCGTDVVLTPIAGVTVYESSEWAERGFCANCGTHLFYRLKQSQQYIMPVGLFNIEGLVFDHQIFIDEKPEYYRFANETKDMTGAEVFAAFS